MATIGSIAVAFEADIKGLESGIEDVIDLFDDLSEAVDAISEKLSGLAAQRISLRVDTSEITRATQEIDTLKSTAEASQPVVTPKADSTEVKAATAAVEDLSTAVDESTATTGAARGSLAQLVVTTARYASVAVGAAQAYRVVRENVLGYVQAATGAETATDAMVTVQAALRGNTEAIRTVMTAVSNAVMDYTRKFFSAGGAARAFDAAIRLTARAIGITDNALVESISYLSSFVTKQIAAAATGTLTNRTLTVVGQAYNRAGAAIEGFLARSESGTKIGSALASAIDRIAPAVARMNSYFNQAANATTRFFQTLGRTESVSKAVGGAFDALYRSIQGVASGSTSISTALGSLATRLASLVPSSAAVAAGLSRAAGAAGAAIGVFNRLIVPLQFIYSGSQQTAAGFAQLVAQFAASSAAFGAAGGALSAFAAGTSVLGGAVGGAVSGVAGFVATLPMVAPVAIAAAVATGRFHHELEQLSVQAQQVDQMADRFGAPRSEIEKLRLSASNTGVGLSQLAKGQQNFYTSLSKIKTGQMNVENVREAKLAFDALDISMSSLKNARPDEVFRMVAEKISEIEDPAKRTQVAFDLFGKQGAAILPALKEFGELSADFDRLGGSLNQIDFDRFLTLENSFDRQKAAAANLGQALLLPFVELQKAFNNISADISGGLAAALTPVMSLIAEMTKPFAVVIEIVGRVINTMLRLAGAAATIVTAFASATGIAVIFRLLQDVFNEVWASVEAGVKAIEGFASTVSAVLTPTVGAFVAVGEAVVRVVDTLASLIGLGDVFIGTSEGGEQTATTFGRVTAAVVSLGVAYVAVTSSSRIFTAVMATSAGTAIASALSTAAAWIGAGLAITGALAVGAVVAIGVYIASVLSALATTIASAAAMHVAWLFALGPIGLLIGGVELVGGALVGLYALGGSVVDFFSGWGEGVEKIDAATASVDELAAAAEESQKSNEDSGFLKDMEALAIAAGYSQEEIDATKQAMQEYAVSAATSVAAGMGSIADSVGAAVGYSQEEIDAFKQSVSDMGAQVAGVVGLEFTPEVDTSEIERTKEVIQGARDDIGDLTIRAAQFGSAGEEAASAAQKSFSELQQSFADGNITLEEFEKETGKVREKLEENLDVLANDSPEVTLKKNLDLYKQLGDAAKQAGKEMRDAMADVKIGDKFFPRSEEVKAKAQEFQDKYAAALEAIKKKQQAGDFGRELTAKKKQNEDDFAAGRITKEQFQAVKLRLDSTSSQEEAQKAAEDAKRTFENDMGSLDLSFADDIRKRLQDAFKSPVDRFRDELKKVRENMDLTPEEKTKAESMLRKEAREGLIGKTAGEKFTERNRDIQQAESEGLINSNEAMIEAAKAADELAKSLGIPVDPANGLKIATLQLEEEFKNGRINAEQFAEGMKNARKSFLESLGIKEKPGEADKRQMDELNKRRGKPLSEGGITEDEFQRGRQAIENNIIGQSASDRIREQRSRIEQGMASGAVGEGRGQAALRGLDRDRKQAAGLDLSAGEQMQAGVDKINDAFGVAGKSMAEIQATLSPKEFADYQEALKKNSDAVKQSLGIEKSAGQQVADSRKKLDKAFADGVISAKERDKAIKKQKDEILASLGIEKSGAEKLAESREKLDKALADGVITAEQRDKAVKQQKDSLLSSLGISKSPAQEFEDAVAKIRENASELSPEELAKGLKEAKDKLLSSLGIEKSPAQAASEQMDKLREAFKKGQISAEEFAKGSQKAKDSLLQALGIPLDPVTQLRQRMNDLNEALDSGQITQEEFSRGQEEAKRSMLPGGEAESPVKKFQRDMDAVSRAVEEGLISDEEGVQRKKNLQAQLQEDLKPSLDNLKPDRRAVESSDVRSKAGVDTFFRILRGNDNPSLKAQLEIARNTKVLAEAAKEPDAAPVIAQLR